MLATIIFAEFWTAAGDAAPFALAAGACAFAWGFLKGLEPTGGD